MYNKGHRKVPDGAVVLLIGKNNQALDEKTIEYFVRHNEQIRKEAVKEFAEKVFGEISPSIMWDKIDELLKEYEK